MILLTVVYSRAWYHDLKIVVLQVQEDIMDSPRFPAVVLLQDVKQNTMANLVDSAAPKCFSGLFDSSAPPCETLSAEQYLNQSSCNCNNSISSSLDGTFSWSVGTFKYFLFRPPMNTISKHPGYHMTLQAFFNYNASEALASVTTTPSPDLQLAIFDPGSGLEQALNSSYSPINLINTNGISYIHLDLNLRRDRHLASIYDYDPTISTSPNLGLVCDTSANMSNLCHASLELQFTSHDRKITVERRGMTWVDAAVSAGAYFAFVQFLSWIVSGQVWAT